jgi:NAD dependent epimerase/dehydratase family enzyme
MNRTPTIAISGASGLIGSRLKKYFKSKNRRVIPLSRNDFAGSTEALSQKLDQANVVINLTGAPVI